MRYRTDVAVEEPHIAIGLGIQKDKAIPMDSWGGHLPVTTTALLSIFDKKAAGASDLTMADRVLYTACEIRCAVATHNLANRLGNEDPVAQIHHASAAFAAIGAIHSVHDLRRAADEFAAAPTAGRRRHCLAVLEDRLLCTEDPIDALIARYAWGCLRGCLRSASVAS